ncbi:Monofunctional biosynthetic peptidoglycan transglycosylase [Emticicia oligotrophica DSM 17448]|uniref:Biosynthetic peptidoglycan transglycosylase n=1 Tax=Emticicia oligotrophica (strain DSM 17448 / CIP 109782 / MTCC 6937 / GPTSA100-15) TaxID=929562 RepID=A0ABM5MZ96_EMTOG|nr:monofunctional biosynthetic peptidoglycan transglycosylase [Emticicia oligotrophica]AFK02413.1 Monofunctional biosynthetic peptidoglycan transglycosylase [Emticicia oligotrophica DSM 17448]
MSKDPRGGKNTFRTKNNKSTEGPISKKKSSNWKSKLKRLVLKTLLYFFIISLGLVVVYKFVPIPVTSTMISRKMEAIEEGKDSEIHYDWVSYDEISKEAPLAVVAAEDQLFPEHNGFDFEAMSNAFTKNLKGKKLRGASTLSQQVAKNVFLWQSRSYIRKVFEVYFTVLIELIWGKQRILEVYLNVAEMGDMTFGVEEASQRFFNTSAKNLSRQEAARIAAVLPSPRKWSAAKPGPYVNRRTNAITRQMRALGGITYISGLRSF